MTGARGLYGPKGVANTKKDSHINVSLCFYKWSGKQDKLESF